MPYDLFIKLAVHTGMNINNQPRPFNHCLLFLLVVCGLLILNSCDPQGNKSSTPLDPDTNTADLASQDAHPERVGITLFLRHQQSKSLNELLDSLKARKFYRNFPPDGVEVVRWDVVMGIGQIVTVLAEPEDIRKVNTAIEKRAWGSFDTEFYPTYVPADPAVSTAPLTENITNDEYVLFTVIADHTGGLQFDSPRPELSSLPDGVQVETIRRLMGRGTLYTFRVPPSRASSLNHSLERWVHDADDLEVYTSYNFLPIHQNITDTGSAD